MTSPFEEGDPKSKIAFVGEAPARTEMRMGRPFVGQAGMVFEECLHAAGLIRRQAYITNVFEFECYKTRGAGERMTNKHTGDAVWTKKSGFTEAGLKSVALLKQRLDKCKANVIVALGNVAMDALCDLVKIGKWRGSILKSSILEGTRKVIPTYHPATILYGQFLDKYFIIYDMKRAKEEMATPTLNLPKRELIIDPQFSECISFLKSLKGAKAIAFDTEIYNGQISCISFSKDPSVAISIPFLDRSGRDRWSEGQELQIMEQIALTLDTPKILKVNQNILFDMFMLLYRWNVYTRGPLGDTMVAFNLMYPDFKKGLDTICSLYTREPYYKDEGKIWQNPFKDMDGFWRYNAKDAAVALEAWYSLAEEMEKEGYRKTHDETTELYEPLLFMMIKGLQIDKEELENTRVKQQHDLEAAETRLKEIADYPFNALSPKQCQQYFYIHKGARPLVSPKTHKVTTDDLALARLWRRHHWPEIKAVQDIRNLNKLVSGYLDVNLDPDGRLRCSYNPRGTWTGRLSSSETVFRTGLNMQNLDPMFKAFIVPDRE